MRPIIDERLTSDELASLQRLWGTAPQRMAKVRHSDKLIKRGFADPLGDRVALSTRGSEKLVCETTRVHWLSNVQASSSEGEKAPARQGRSFYFRRFGALRRVVWLAAGFAVLVLTLVASMTSVSSTAQPAFSIAMGGDIKVHP